MPLTVDLKRAGMDVRVLSKSTSRTHILPAGTDIVVADVLADPYATKAAFTGVDVVYMVNHSSPTETIEGLLLVELARQSAVPRFVYQSVHNMRDLAYLPHLGSKLAIQSALERSGMDYTIIAPNCFFQNDLLSKQAMVVDGVYPQPIGLVGCMSVDVRDIAAAAFAVMTSSGHSAKTYNVVGPDLLTSANYARNWSEALGRNITADIDIDAWKRSVPFLPRWLTLDLGLMYEDFNRRGMIGSQEDVAEMTKLLGRAPRSHSEFAREIADIWSSEASSVLERATVPS